MLPKKLIVSGRSRRDARNGYCIGILDRLDGEEHQLFKLSECLFFNMLQSLSLYGSRLFCRQLAPQRQTVSILLQLSNIRRLPPLYLRVSRTSDDCRRYTYASPEHPTT